MKIIRHISVNILLALVWIFFAYQNLTAFFETQKITLLLFVLVQTEFVIFLLIRRQAIDVSGNIADYAVAIAGTFTALFFQPVAAVDILNAAGTVTNLGGDTLVYLAVIFEIAGFLSLNTSSGIVPANRGIKTGGLYKYVRHPIYASYIFLYAGYVIGNPSSYNMAVLVFALALQIARIYREEKLLAKDEAYRKYSDVVRWRLIPGVF